MESTEAILAREEQEAQNKSQDEKKVKKDHSLYKWKKTDPDAQKVIITLERKLSKNSQASMTRAELLHDRLVFSAIASWDLNKTPEEKKKNAAIKSIDINLKPRAQDHTIVTQSLVLVAEKEQLGFLRGGGWGDSTVHLTLETVINVPVAQCASLEGDALTRVQGAVMEAKGKNEAAARMTFKDYLEVLLKRQFGVDGVKGVAEYVVGVGMTGPKVLTNKGEVALWDPTTTGISGQNSDWLVLEICRLLWSNIML